MYSGPDSKASYNALINVMKTIDFEAQGIKLTIQHVPLPYHYFSFKMHQGKHTFYLALIYVQNKTSVGTAKSLIDYFYQGNNQDQFT